MALIRVRNYFLLTVLNLFLVSSGFCQTTSRISGSVVDATSGDPLPGANVLLQGTSIGGSTDINGKYEIRNVPAGSYTIRVTYIGYDPLSMMVQVKGGADLNSGIQTSTCGNTRT